MAESDNFALQSYLQRDREMRAKKAAESERRAQQAREKALAAEKAAKEKRRMEVIQAKSDDLLRRRAAARQEQEALEEAEMAERELKIKQIQAQREAKERADHAAEERKKAIALSKKLSEERAQKIADQNKSAIQAKRSQATLDEKFAEVDKRTSVLGGDDTELRRIRIAIETERMHVNVIDGVKWAIAMDGSEKFDLRGTALENVPARGEYVTKIDASVLDDTALLRNIETTKAKSDKLQDKTAEFLASLKS